MGLINTTRRTQLSAKELLARGLPGRGVIVSVQRTAASSGAGDALALVCVFTVEVTLRGVPRYTATCRQTVRAALLPRLISADAIVAVRVDPGDHSRIALAPGEQPPSFTVARSNDQNAWSAARILEVGVPCTAVIVESLGLGMRTTTGDDLYAFTLRVIAEQRPPYEIQVGNPVPATALALLYAGNTVPARRIPDGDDRELAIDWKAALAQLSTTAA
jgi:hypothetical protein